MWVISKRYSSATAFAISQVTDERSFHSQPVIRLRQWAVKVLYLPNVSNGYSEPICDVEWHINGSHSPISQVKSPWVSLDTYI
jgi:hypothetical protein